jgi:hypothetical protein
MISLQGGSMKWYLLLSAFLIICCASGFAQLANNQNAPCSSFPCIVASISLTNQTVPVSQVPIYTPTTDGLFRVVYYEEASNIGFGVWVFTWRWTDDLQTEAQDMIQLTSGRYANYGVTGIRALAGHPITYTVTHRFGGGSWNLFATVEQLQ